MVVFPHAGNSSHSGACAGGENDANDLNVGATDQHKPLQERGSVTKAEEAQANDLHAHMLKHAALAQERLLKVQALQEQLQQARCWRADELAQVHAAAEDKWRLKLEALQKQLEEQAATSRARLAENKELTRLHAAAQAEWKLNMADLAEQLEKRTGEANLLAEQQTMAEEGWRVQKVGFQKQLEEQTEISKVYKAGADELEAVLKQAQAHAQVAESRLVNETERAGRAE